MLSTSFNIPIQNNCVRDVIHAQPDGQTPVEWLAVNDINGVILLTWYKYICATNITMNNCESIQVFCAFQNGLWMLCVDFTQIILPVRFQFMRKFAQDVLNPKS